jgi:hypothetical protein
MVKLLPIAVCLNCFETPFLSPIMISMQANQRERTSWLYIFFLVWIQQSPLDLPNLQKQWESLPILIIIQSHHQHDNPL